MSRFSKTLVAILLILAILMALLAFYLMSITGSKPAPTTPQVSSTPAAKPIPTVDVVVAASALPAGKVLEAQDLKIAKWAVMPELGYTDNTRLLGQRLRYAVGENQPVLESVLAQGLANYIEEGQRAITIPVSPLAINGRRLSPGDYVDVFFTLNKKSGEVLSSQSRLLLAKIQLLAIGNQSVDGPLVTENSKGQPPPAPNSAILAVPVADVNGLLLASKEGELQLVLRSHTDEALPNQALFPERAPLLAGKSTLSEDEISSLEQPENKAFAGDSLVQFAGAEADIPTNSSIDEYELNLLQIDPPRTVEIIRGRTRHTEAY